MSSAPVELDPRGQGPDVPWHLSGSRQPVFEEATLTDLEVEGEIPRELNGRYFRNTANPVTGYTEHWFIGDGMIHGVELREGKANWYRNRWVRTPMFDHPGVDRLTLALDKKTIGRITPKTISVHQRIVLGSSEKISPSCLDTIKSPIFRTR